MANGTTTLAEISTILFDGWDDDIVDTHIEKLELSALCCDEEVKGFDKNTGTSWIYPTNYPLRNYQFNIVQSALFNNTLVSLPTGLGKTFIAAVVMYNFYRWYPQGKIIFTAPTRPLVAQQIEACYKIMAIPPSDTVEMTGSMQIANRKIAWQEKRVFYATPQVIQNDLESGSCPIDMIRCVVIDEAHRARGKHAYCQLMEILNAKKHSTFRVLALSATPGGKVDDVVNVVKNLHISHLEFRSENSLDVAGYSHSRKIETIEVLLGDELSKIRRDYVEILDIYTRRLVQYNILSGNIGNLSKGRIIMLFKEYQSREKAHRHPQHKQIMYDFTMVITLYHALELLTKHGSRVFLKFFDEHTDKSWIGKDSKLTGFLETLKNNLGVNPFSIDRSPLPNGNIPEFKVEINYGHPKFDKLKEIILTHFEECQKENRETKAIVFCEYRESVNLVHCLLLQCRPLIKPQMFIGQGSGASKENGMSPFSQKKQLHIMKLFREGACNVLVSTCVGEEGLDIGSVDLIVCFDISTKSPVRLIQRCGRTGRERGGKVFILVTEGREHQTLRECIYQRDNINNKILSSKELKSNLYSLNPRMVSNHIKPVCQKMHITIKKETANVGQRKIRDMFGRKISFDRDSDFKSSSESPFLSDEEFSKLCPSGILPESDLFPSPSLCIFSKDEKYDKLSNWLEWQRNPQYCAVVGHSNATNALCELLVLAEKKKFNLPYLTQDANVVESAPPVSFQPSSKTNEKKSHNIVDMFKKISKKNKGPDTIFDIKLKEVLADLGIDYDGDVNVLNAVCQKYKVEREILNLLVELKIDKFNSNTEERSNIFSDYFSEDTNDCKHFTDLNVNSLDLSIIPDNQWGLFDFSSVNLIKSPKIQSDLSPKILFKPPEPPSPNIIIEKQKTDEKVEEINRNPKIEEKTLDFFGLNSLDDIFEDESNSLGEYPTSPILCSQRPKSKNTPIKENISCVINTKVNNDSSFLTPTQVGNTEIQKNTKLNNDSSFLTVTQIIDLIEQKYEATEDEPPHKSPIARNDFQKSPILSQNVNHRRKKFKPEERQSFIILETSESSQSENEQIPEKNSNGSFEAAGNSASPFFNSNNNQEKSPSIIRRKPLSLKEKLNISLKTTIPEKNQQQPASFLSQFALTQKPKLDQKNIDSEDEFESILKLLPSPPKKVTNENYQINKKTPRKRKKKKKKCDFIEYEAELSTDGDNSSDESCDSSKSQLVDTSLIEFICDEDAPVCDESVDMHAKYLQSIKSPVKTAGQFKIPKIINKSINVFSQAVPEDVSNYELDSFCVDADEGLTQQQDMSELEIAEALLRKRKRRKRERPHASRKSPPKVFNPANDSPIAANKRKKIKHRINSDSDTEDDLFL